MSIASVRPSHVCELIGNGTNIELIDVRTPAEFEEVHATNARNVPLDQLDPAAWLQNSGDREQPIYVICKSGKRGEQAAERFDQAGFTKVFNVEGGTMAWDVCGLPVVRGKKAISLERQVRIAAGFLVVLGVALGWLVHPGFLGISAFVGLGLMYAGITDTCGMGMILARMPWNRRRPACACCSSQG